ncbi:magnesium/cobalt transporter CorA [candidate division GN15 bacterium]|nr:magnesium/cobalt transporter CorA [candidate division GN15 bacterium]
MPETSSSASSSPGGARKRSVAGKVGLMPGSLVYVGEKREGPVRLSVLDFDATTHEFRDVKRVEELFAYRDSDTNSWIRVNGIHDVTVIEQLGAHFGIHALTLEDILNTGVRPRFEDNGEYLSIVVKAVTYDHERRELMTRQVAVVWGKGWVISFEETPESMLEPVRTRIEKTVPRLRMVHADYLAYALIDLIVDHYFLAFERLGEQIEEIEDDLVEHENGDRLPDILTLKRVLTSMRRAVWPVRETVGMLDRSDSPLVRDEMSIYVRDLYEHTLQVLDLLETYREMVSGLLDIHLTSVSNKMNSVMKVLTIIATIFIPLGFLAGVYGMNFDTDISPFNLPELGLRYGYPLFWLLVVVIAGGLAIWFKRKRWL